MNLATALKNFRETENEVSTMPKAKLELCYAIRKARKEKRLSLRNLATKVGISAAFLSDIELGRRFPSKENLTKILNELAQKAT